MPAPWPGRGLSRCINYRLNIESSSLYTVVMTDEDHIFPAMDMILSGVDLMREGSLWPSDEYDEQVRHLRSHTGKPIYIVEIKITDINLAVTMQGRAVILLDVIAFPAPDPEQRLYPHMLLLNDGRGLNLGRVARITTGRAFDPSPQDILFQEHQLLKSLLFHERRLSDESVAQVSKLQLARVLGRQIKQITEE